MSKESYSMDKECLRLADVFTEYIRQGKKDVITNSLGVEIEHFILDADSLESVPYLGRGGIKEITEEFMSHFPDADPIIGEDFLGFSVKDFNVTLEPAAQMEISIVQNSDIDKIGNIYKDFYELLSQILKPLNKKICCIGCQPVSHVDNLALIPKGRYRLMDEHFKKTGTGGREMMRGTASTQVSVDYADEEDFKRKLQAAYYFMPFFKLGTDRVKTFQGKPVGMRLKRTDIWNRTDPARCGILPGVFKPDYGFRDYAEYVCKVPLIFLPNKDEEVYTDFATGPELFEGKEITKSDIEHIFSMPFPDVRVKRYLEIRGADSMPFEGVMAFCTLIKGLLYSDEVLDYVQTRIKDKSLDENSLRESEESLMKHGFEGNIYGESAIDFAEDTLKICRNNLSSREEELLDGWDWITY